MEQLDTRARARITTYTAALFIALATFLFLSIVPFVPDSPVIPFLLAVVLAAFSLRNRGTSVACLYLLVFFAVLWQMIGFGFFQLLKQGVGIAVVIIMILPILAYTSRKVELTSLPIAFVCVALMFTPAYFVSIPLIAAAATVTGFASLEALSVTFIMFLAPFLLLENALYFVTTPGATSPIVFAELTNLKADLRPSLPSLNLVLTPVPVNFVSVHAQAVSTYLMHEWIVIVVPLVLVGLAIMAAASAGGIVRTLLQRLASLRESERVRRFFTPLAVSVTVPVVFVLLTVPLSLPGGYQTSLASGPFHVTAILTVASSVVLGGVFVARESLVLRTEKVELGREGVKALVRECNSKLGTARVELQQMSSKVPSMGIGVEEMSLSEHASYLGDVEKRVDSAAYESVVQWKSHLEGAVLPALNEAPARLKRNVLNELATLNSVIMTVNNHLAEAFVPLRYTQVPDINPDSDMGAVTDAHAEVVKAISKDTEKIFESYRSAYSSFNTLMGLHEASIPVGPTALLGSHEYITAMRLVSEEYWLNFHLRYAEDFEAKKGPLLEQLARLNVFLTKEEATALNSIVEAVSSAKPAASTETLARIQELRELLSKVISELASGPEMVKKTMKSFDPKVTGVLAFQTLRQENELVMLEKELNSAETSFEGLTKFISWAVPVLANQASAWKSDQENLVIIAHYPLASRVIQRMLPKQGKLKVERLPYAKRTAVVYARLMAAEVPGWSYDEEGGVLTIHA